MLLDDFGLDRFRHLGDHTLAETGDDPIGDEYVQDDDNGDASEILPGLLIMRKIHACFLQYQLFFCCNLNPQNTTNARAASGTSANYTYEFFFSHTFFMGKRGLFHCENDLSSAYLAGVELVKLLATITTNPDATLTHVEVRAFGDGRQNFRTVLMQYGKLASEAHGEYANYRPNY